MKKTEEFKVDGKDLKKKVEGLLHEGNVRQIIIRNKDGEDLITIPLTIGVVGVVVVPILAAVGAIAAVVTECSIVVVRDGKKK